MKVKDLIKKLSGHDPESEVEIENTQNTYNYKFDGIRTIIKDDKFQFPIDFTWEQAQRELDGCEKEEWERIINIKPTVLIGFKL